MAKHATINARLAALGLVRAFLTNDATALAILLPATDPPTTIALTQLAANWIESTAVRDGITCTEAIDDLVRITVDSDTPAKAPTARHYQLCGPCPYGAPSAGPASRSTGPPGKTQTNARRISRHSRTACGALESECRCTRR